MRTRRQTKGQTWISCNKKITFKVWFIFHYLILWLKQLFKVLKSSESMKRVSLVTGRYALRPWAERGAQTARCCDGFPDMLTRDTLQRFPQPCDSMTIRQKKKKKPALPWGPGWRGRKTKNKNTTHGRRWKNRQMWIFTVLPRRCLLTLNCLLWTRTAG